MKKKNKWRSIDIRVIAVVVSLLLSALMVLPGWFPNEDAFTYVRTIEIFTDSGLAAAFDHYPWATYSVLVGIIHRTLNIDPFNAALFFNALVYSLLVYSFISVVAEIDNTRRTIILAAITVLVYPQLNEFRLVIIRDSAFWALMLFGLWQFLLFLRTETTTNAVSFAAACLLAATFRVEAILFLLVIPLTVLFDNRLEPRRRWQLMGYFIVYTAGVSVALSALLFLAGFNVLQLASDQLSVYLPFIRESFFPAEDRSAELGRAIFGEYAANFSADYLGLFMFTGLFAVFLANLYKGIGGPFLLVMLAGTVKKQWHITRWQLVPLMMIAFFNVVIAMAFLITTRFLSSRYVMMLSLVLALFIPLLLERLLQFARDIGREKLAIRLVGLLLVYCAIDAYVSFGTDRSYLREGGEWIAANTPEQIALLTNNRAVAYYSERVEDYDLAPVIISEEDILQTAPGALIAFEEDTPTVNLFAEPRVVAAVEEVIRFGPESSRQLVIYRRL